MTDPITPLTPQQTATEEAQAAREGYFRRLEVAVDETLGVMAGGPPHLTISTDAALAAKHNEAAKILSELLDLLQKDHGADAAAGDLERDENSENLIKQAEILDQKPQP